MRLWHYQLIPVLPRQQLLGQHRECCALRGLAWGRKHSTVNYVFRYPPEYLFNYHECIIREMKQRGYNPNPLWTEFTYRGKRSPRLDERWTARSRRGELYPEHDGLYLISCYNFLTARIRSAPEGRYNQGEVLRLYEFGVDAGIEKK